ncbi:MAG: hypothetical protein MUC63_00125, partial [Planctomycetes bacterium]|nr:hypothetical protein [Planctomycetota bacterium]
RTGTAPQGNPKIQIMRRRRRYPSGNDRGIQELRDAGIGGPRAPNSQIPESLNSIKRALPATEARNARFQVSGSRLQVQDEGFIHRAPEAPQGKKPVRGT